MSYKNQQFIERHVTQEIMMFIILILFISLACVLQHISFNNDAGKYNFDNFYLGFLFSTPSLCIICVGFIFGVKSQ
jgi:hypothetical protein